MTANENETKIDSYIIFKMFDEFFAINVIKVLHILEMQKITEVPKAPSYMKGVMNLRGEVIPIIDSHKKLGHDTFLTVTKNTCILVLEIQPSKDEMIKLGLLVDHVDEVIEIKKDTILPPPTIGNSFKSEYITGMYQKTEAQFVMVIDIDKLLNIAEIMSVSLESEVEKNN